MISLGGYYYGPWESNPKRWARALREVTLQMVAEGWKTYANKFDRVLKKRAIKLFNGETIT